MIFASDKPLNATDITELVNNALGFIEDRAEIDQVEAAIQGIRENMPQNFMLFELRQSGGGWQFLTKPEFHRTVALLNGDKFIKRLSTAALETLAIIAYKQPITKSEIESIRGVNCDYAVQNYWRKISSLYQAVTKMLWAKPSSIPRPNRSWIISASIRPMICLRSARS